VRIRDLAVPLLAGMLVCAGTALAAEPHNPAARAGPGGIGVRLLSPPAVAGDPLGRSYVVERLAPGKSVRRRIEIRNSTLSSAAVSVYPAAADLRRGAFAFADGRSQNELSRWTSLDREVLRLRPGGATFETVTIRVPKDASPGVRYAVIWAEISAPAAAVGSVKLVNRVGIRMYISVGPGGAPRSNFAIGPLSAGRTASGAPLVVANVRNNGGRTLEIGGNLTLVHGPAGLRAGPFPVTLGATLAPGGSEPVSVRLDRRLPQGPWRARLRLGSGLVQREAAATITFPQVAPAGSHHRTLAILLVVLLAVAAALLLLSRRSRQLSAAPHRRARVRR